MLGVQDRGQLALIVLFPTLITQLGGLGVPLATTYYLAKEPESARSLIRRLVRLMLAQAVGLCAIQFAVIHFVFDDAPAPVQFGALISIAAVPAILAGQYGLAVLQGLQSFLAFNVFRVLAVILYSSALVVIAFVPTAGLPAVVAAWVGAYLLADLACAVFAWATLRSLGPKQSSVPIRKILGFGVRGLFSWVSPIEGLRADQQVIALLISPAALGLYVVGQAMTNLPRFVAQSIGLVSYPHVAALSPSAGRKAMWRFFWLATVTCSLIVVVLELAAGTMVPVFFGAAFRDAVPVTRILLIAALFMGIRRTLTDGVRGLGYPTLGTGAEVLSWLIAVPGIFVLGPRFGITGVSVALVVASAVSLAALLIATCWLSFFDQSKLRWQFWISRSAPAVALGAGVAVSVVMGLLVPALLGFVAAHPEASTIVGLGLVACAPIAVRIYQRRFDVFEPISIAALTWLLLFVARPILDLRVNHLRYLGMDLRSSYSTALLIALVSIGCCSLAYFSPLGQRLARWLPAPPATVSEDSVALSAWGLTAVAAVFVVLIAGARGGYGALLLNRTVDVPHGAPFVAEGFLFAVPAALLLATARSQHRWILRLAASLPLGIVMLLSLPGGNRRYLLPALLGFVVLYYLRRARRPSVLVAAVAVLVLLIGVISPAREARDGKQSYRAALGKSVLHPGHAWTQLLRVGDTAMIDDDALLARAMGHTVGYRHGVEFVGDTLLSPLPRQVWRSKPEKIRTLVTKAYFGTDRDGRCVSQCPTFSFAGESFADFGFVSVAIISALFGVLLAAGYQYLALYSRNRLVQVAYASSLWLAFHAWQDGLSSVFYTFVIFVVPVVITGLIAGRGAQEAVHRKSLGRVSTGWTGA